MNIIITGAGRGIGYELVKKFSGKQNNTVYAVSRSKEKLQQLQSECAKLYSFSNVHVVPFDLLKLSSEDLPGKINAEHIDILIQCAGILVNKPFRELSSEEMLDMAHTNFIAPAQFISLLAPRLGGEKPSHVVNIGSMGGYQGSVKFPGLSVYSATKAALASITECLAAEFAGSNVFFNCLALGAVQTEMLEEAFPGYNALVTAEEMADYIAEFALSGYKYYNGKVLPVSLSTP